MAGENKNDLIVPGDFLESAKMLQQDISETPFEARQQKAQQAIDIIGRTREYAGSRSILVHALSSYIVLECLDRAEVDTVELDEMIVKGNLAGVSYLEDGFAMSSLCVAVGGADVIWKKTWTSRKHIDDGYLYVPVFSVESIWPAA